MINSDREYPFDQTISQPSQRRNDEPMMQPDIQSAPASQDDDNGAAELNPAQGYDDPFPQCPDQWYNERAEELQRTIAEKEARIAELQNRLDSLPENEGWSKQ